MPGRIQVTTEMIAKRRETRLQNAARLRRDFADMYAWDGLAHRYGARQPPIIQAVTTGAITTWCRRLKVNLVAYREWWGGTSLRSFQTENPDWPLRAWVGLVLEAIEQGHLQSGLTPRTD